MATRRRSPAKTPVTSKVFCRRVEHFEVRNAAAQGS